MSPTSSVSISPSARHLPAFGSRLMRKFLLVLIISMAGLAAMSFTSWKRESLGVADGRLTPCPNSPNCVSTQAEAEDQRIDAIPYKSVVTGISDPSAIRQQLRKQIKEAVNENFSRVEMVSESDNYLRFEFKSLIFRFADDVEFYLDDIHQKIHFRSASRIGHSDLGVNRKRMNKISQELKK